MKSRMQHKLLRYSWLAASWAEPAIGSALAVGEARKAEHDENHRREPRAPIRGEDRPCGQRRARRELVDGGSRSFLGMGGSACFPPILTGGMSR